MNLPVIFLLWWREAVDDFWQIGWADDARQLDVFDEAARTVEAAISQDEELLAADEPEATVVDDMTGILVDAVVVAAEEEAGDVDAILMAWLLLTMPEFSFCSSLSDTVLLTGAASGTTWSLFAKAAVVGWARDVSHSHRPSRGRSFTKSKFQRADVSRWLFANSCSTNRRLASWSTGPNRARLIRDRSRSVGDLGLRFPEPSFRLPPPRKSRSRSSRSAMTVVFLWYSLSKTRWSPINVIFRRLTQKLCSGKRMRDFNYEQEQQKSSTKTRKFQNKITYNYSSDY